MADNVESGSTIVAASAAAAARAANRFGMGLFAFLAAAAAAAAAAKKVNREAPRAANVFFSPPSLLSTLGLLASAATEGSAAAVELDAVAGLRLTDDETAAAVFGEGGRSARPGSLHAVMSPDNDAGVALHYTSGVWLRGGIDATYSQRVAALYGATAAALTTAAPINAAVAAATDGAITDLVANIRPDDVAVLVNVITFRGTWTTPFDPAATRVGTFYAAAGSRGGVPASFMHLQLPVQGSALVAVPPSAECPGLTLVELPYGEGGAFVADFILPDSRRRGRMAAVAAAMPAAWDSWVAALMSSTGSGSGNGGDRGNRHFAGGRADLSLPRFRLVDGVTDVIPALQAAGVTTIFTGAPGGAFRRMTLDPQAAVTVFVYKAALEVTEAGTTAATAAAAVVSRCVPPPRRPVVFDRPFGVVLRHRPTGAVLFTGVVADPQLVF